MIQKPLEAFAKIRQVVQFLGPHRLHRQQRDESHQRPHFQWLETAVR